MAKYFKTKYIFNVLLFFWCLSTPFRNNLFTILIVAFFITVLVGNHDYRLLNRIISKSRPFIFTFLTFIISITFSNLINENSYPDIWTQELKFVFRLPVLILILMYFHAKEFFTKESLIIYVVFSLLVQSIDGIYQYALGYDLFKQYPGNLCSGLTAANPNRALFGFLMGTGLILTSVLLINNKKGNIREAFFLIIISTFLFGLIYSFTRGSWLSFSFSIIILYLFNYKNIKAKHLFYFFIFSSLAAVAFSNSDCLNTRVIQISTGNSSGRFELWYQAIDYIQQKPIFGWGLHNIEAVHSLGNNQLKYVHNSILELLVKTGITGFLIFTSIVLISLRIQIINKSWGLLSIFLFLIIISLFDHSILLSNVFISVLAIVLFFIHSLPDHKSV